MRKKKDQIVWINIKQTKGEDKFPLQVVISIKEPGVESVNDEQSCWIKCNLSANDAIIQMQQSVQRNTTITVDKW